MYGYIYKTTNILNDKIYIGKKKGKFISNYKGSGRYLRNAIKKYGFENFSVEIIEWCENLEKQNEREKYWIAYFEEAGYEMYNISKGGDGGDTFYKLSDKDRNLRIENLRKSTSFHNISIESRYKAWDTRRLHGKDKASEELKEKLRLSHLGKKRSLESIQKGVNSRKGYKHSKETIQKIKKGNLGKTVTKETRDKLSCIWKGKRNGKENPFYGKRHSDETKQKIGAYNKERFRDRIWINNGIINKRVINSDLEKYKKLGFVEGRIKWQQKH